MARLKKPWVASVEYKQEFYKAAVFPDENNKLDVTIMESVKAARRDVVGLHIYNVPLRLTVKYEPINVTCLCQHMLMSDHQ